MKINKGHMQTGIATFILAISGQYGITEYINPQESNVINNQQKQIIIDEVLEKTKEYIKSSEYNNDFHKSKFLEFIKSPDFEKEVEKIFPTPIMNQDDRKRFIKLMRSFNDRFPEDHVWIIE